MMLVEDRFGDYPNDNPMNHHSMFIMGVLLFVNFPILISLITIDITPINHHYIGVYIHTYIDT
jgi:hypothetical protein